MGVLDDKNSSSSLTNSSSTTGLGGKLVIGIFDALQDLTSDVGRLVGTVEEVLGSKREDVVKLADRVEDNVDSLQSLLANGSKFILSSGEEHTEKSDMANSSSVVIEIEESDLINDSTVAKEPTVVEQSVLADSSSFIQITDEEIEDDHLDSDVKYMGEDADKLTGEDEEEERELQEDIILDQ